MADQPVLSGLTDKSIELVLSRLREDELRIKRLRDQADAEGLHALAESYEDNRRAFASVWLIVTGLYTAPEHAPATTPTGGEP